MKLRGQIRITAVLGLILSVTLVLPVMLKAEVPHQISYFFYQGSIA
jgi:hypothetical protein